MESIDIGKVLRERISGYDMRPDVYTAGHVLSVSDGVVCISGVPGAKYGELLAMGGDVFAIAMNLEEDEVGAVLLNGEDKVRAGMEVRGTGGVVEVPVGEALLGRVVSPLGVQLDGKGPIAATGHRPIETPAPSIIDREPVTRPLETGIIAIDAIIPIGRGQRELIIGDRQVGKTAIAVSAMLNQKGKDVVCIYVAIGQKASTIAQVIHQLEKGGAMPYSIVVAATASDTAPMQYIAPYAGCAMAEEFMHSGKDVLIVYDDLSKHAVAYRAMSLLLRRPPGREAYPGDVFYLHSRLLERAAQLSKENGGGSISALPIVETMSGDISDYIPTNVISITDGQIFLETELFHAGVRPALNVGLSVSRVGGSAQAKATRKVASSLRLELAQYRELAVFAQFGSDLDSSTQATLHHGRLLTEMLKQDQFTLHQLDGMVAILFAVSGRYLEEFQPNEMWKILKDYQNRLNKEYPETLKRIRQSREIGEDTEKELAEAIMREVEHYRTTVKGGV